MDIYEKIISLHNITKAYFEVVKKMEKEGKATRYCGVDAITLGDYDFSSEDLLFEIQRELKEKKEISPALAIKIPKRTKLGKRTIYIHSVKERIKAQAVYRVISPIFDSFFSQYLFSYRSSHPHYKAVRTIARRYRKKYDEYVLVGDIASYSDVIHPDVLKKQIRDFKFSDRVNQLLFLYVDMKFLSNGVRKSSPRGIITGLPVTVLFNNLYLDAMDKLVGKSTDLYRRVGDDFIVFGTYDDLISTKKKITNKLLSLSIPEEHHKMNLLRVTDNFNFLGYSFHDGLISILPFSLKQIQKKIRFRLRYRESDSLEKKKIKLKKILFSNDSIKYDFIQIVIQYNYSNDIDQMKFIDNYLMVRMTIFFFNSYTPRNRRKLKSLISDIKIPSLLRYYLAFHTGVCTRDDLKHLI